MDSHEMIDVTEMERSSDTLRVINSARKEGAGQKSSLDTSCPYTPDQFVSTAATAKSRWPLSYTTYRNNVADRLGINLYTVALEISSSLLSAVAPERI